MPLNHKVPLLQVEDLKRYYSAKGGMFSRSSGETRIADGVSFSLYKGKTLGPVGESDCGRSTLGCQIVGLERPTRGRILYQEKDLANISAGQMRSIRAQLQMVFRDSYSSLSLRKHVYGILSKPMLYHGLTDKNITHREVERLLDMMGLPQNALGRYPHEFSGGQRQRIGIARALLLEPQLLIYDEPVGALDVPIQARVLNLLKELQQEPDLTCIFIGHGLGTVNYVSDCIAVMCLGQTMELADSRELFEHSQYPYSKALLDAVSLTDPRTRKRRGKGIIEGEAEPEIGPADGCPFYPRCPRRTGECADADVVLQSAPVEGKHLVSCIHAIGDGGRVIQGGVSWYDKVHYKMPFDRSAHPDQHHHH